MESILFVMSHVLLDLKLTGIGYPIWTGEQEMPNSDWDVETDTAGILVRGDKVLYYGCIGHNVEVFNRESKTFYLELSENFWIKDGVLVAEDKDVAEDAMARERLKREFERDDADVEP